MGKKRPAWDEKHYHKYLAEGRGQGTGGDYKPWILIHDFPSQGVSVRIKGRTTGRIHHLLSRNEEYYFYILDADDDVTDIREQFPLRLNETMEIARQLNVRHPKKGSFPFVMTTDFLITRHDGLHARTVKCAKELENQRVMEKFAIEHAYWSSRGVDWKIVTEKEISREKALNCQWLHSGQTAEMLFADPEARNEAMYALLDLVDDDGRLPTDCILPFEEAFGLPAGGAIAVYKSLVLSGLARPDLNRKLFF